MSNEPPPIPPSLCVSRIKIFENLRALTGAPSVQMNEVPPSFMIREEDEDATDPDSRTENDGKRQHDAEFYRDDKVQESCCSKHTIFSRHTRS